ncbi:MAG TPA: hypothetical protein PK453_02985 [Leptospiraceae bacterium]|nr:hypothetical protein [Leptospiraceae bacterium]HNF12608.1 hypothetical protein [Leptospiraceae bacterium]HNF25209.1 hypothetical protein [Leptospiraceae bacterium]HNH10715.1 hypothetical protein [Leptospiraceae bacterium]HNI94548.1 hypothetical protein [Leptospiraceae bacterium]
MNQSIDFQTVMQAVIRVIGAVLISAGAYLGYLSFEKARMTLDNPNTLAVWLELEKKFPAPAENSVQVPAKNTAADPDKALLRMYYEVKSYIILFLSYIYLWILVRISASFIQSGIQILLHEPKPRNKKDENT